MLVTNDLKTKFIVNSNLFFSDRSMVVRSYTIPTPIGFGCIAIPSLQLRLLHLCHPPLELEITIFDGLK